MSQKYPISPLAPKKPKKLAPVAGVRLGVAASGERYQNRDDVLLMEFDPATKVAGVTTRSSMPSAAVDWCRACLKKGQARGLLVNAGNANAFTGKKGARAVRLLARHTGAALSAPPEQIFMASTGVIGEDLNIEPIQKVVTEMVSGDDARALKSSWEQAAGAIMTTDTFPKTVTREVLLAGRKVRINGIAKGSGMIAPDMATMLAFFVTDAALPRTVLQKLLNEAVADSFNAITVDSDTSTSDTVLLFATHAQKHKGPPIRAVSDKRLAAFKKALQDAMVEMAQLIVRDGEGAKKFITVRVQGAQNDLAARRVALSIANSPLVKTAIAGEDANWGRIVMAVGKSGERANRDKLRIHIGGHRVASAGRAVKNFDERPIAKHMRGKEIDILVHLGIGKGQSKVWTSDLTHDYIAINADYRS
ncbi:MAG: bifunctional glutamate N-acetyltransferase/amino-acid acetyltransferase ArgJ [Parvibaculales bacterium]